MSGCGTSEADFRPAAPLANLRRRADLLARARSFFAARGVMEVETPLLGAGVVVERHIDPIPCALEAGKGSPQLYLAASPEGAMKRLLAAGSGPIYQIARAFRSLERGRLHNPEFTILEWYRPGFDHHALMEEVAALMEALLGARGFEARANRDVFIEAVGLDPLRATASELARAARERGISPPAGLGEDDRDPWLDLLLSRCVEPRLGRDRLTFVHDYPASQAALAQVREDGGVLVGERFELYYQGLELANGYRELLDGGEQARRFEEANRLRRLDGKPALPPDRRLLEALGAGLPPCAGVAVGFDRVAMLACGAARLDDVIAFPWERVAAL